MPMLVSLDFLSFAMTGGLSWEKLMHCRVDVGNSVLLQDLKLGGNYSIGSGDQPIHTLTRVSHWLWRRRRNLEVAEYYVLKLLRVVPKLREISIATLFVFDVEQMPEWAPGTTSNFLVRGINKLTIGDSYGCLASIVLPEMTLPSLKCLRYIERSQGGDSVVADLVLRSLPRLECLEIIGCSPSQVALVPTLRLLPTLKTIYISDAEFLSWLFQELANNDDGRMTCPALRKMVVEDLCILDNNDRETTPASLCAMLNSRPGHWTTARINKKKLEIPSDSSDALRELFSENLVMCRDNTVELFGRKGH